MLAISDKTTAQPACESHKWQSQAQASTLTLLERHRRPGPSKIVSSSPPVLDCQTHQLWNIRSSSFSRALEQAFSTKTSRKPSSNCRRCIVSALSQPCRGHLVFYRAGQTVKQKTQSDTRANVCQTAFSAIQNAPFQRYVVWLQMLLAPRDCGKGVSEWSAEDARKPTDEKCMGLGASPCLQNLARNLSATSTYQAGIN